MIKIKHEWRKHEKEIYIPKIKPELVNIPSYKYFIVEGEGNPNDEKFAEYIGVLYSLSYAIRMSPKKGIEPKDYFEYTVYPLEGVWDISENAKKNYNGKIDKNELVYDLMIRQPDFVTSEFALDIIERTKKKKPHEFLDEVKFLEIEEGICVQMMNIGSYDNEKVSFELMEEYCKKNNLLRISKRHKEIYLSDPRKVEKEKLKTVLRFKVKKMDR